MKRLQAVLFAGSVMALFSISMMAHHSFSSEFDNNKRVTVDGVVSKLELVNPHGYVHVDVKDPKDGKITTWLFETHGPGQLRKMGLTKEVLGKQVKVEGYAAKDGSSFAWGTKYEFADGKTVLTYSPREDRK